MTHNLFIFPCYPFPLNNGVNIPGSHLLNILRNSSNHWIVVFLETTHADEDHFNKFNNGNIDAYFIKSNKTPFYRLERLVKCLFTLTPFYTIHNSLKLLPAHILGYSFNKVVCYTIKTYVFAKEINHYRDGILILNDAYSLSLYEQLRINKKRIGTVAKTVWDLIWTKKIESRFHKYFHLITVCANTDKIYLSKLNPRLKVKCITNGVEKKLYELNFLQKKTNKLIYVGTLIEPHLNYIDSFVKNIILPLLKQNHKFKLYIIGKKSSQSYHIIKKFSYIKNIYFIGEIKELKSIYKIGGISIVPICKENGVVNKILEPMAAGNIAISYSKTFINIKEAKNLVNCLMANNSEEFVNQIISVAKEPSIYSRISTNAPGLIRKNFCWIEFEKKYKEILC